MTAHVADERPVLLVPYVWIGDFVRCHSVVKVLKERWPHRPVDILSSTLCAPLADYMPLLFTTSHAGNSLMRRIGVSQRS
jgi:heptosyltransferase-2